MNSITITRLYEQLSSKLGKETAENLITFIEQKVGEEMGNNQKGLPDRRENTNASNSLDSSKVQKKSAYWNDPKWLLIICAWLILIIVLILTIRSAH